MVLKIQVCFRFVTAGAHCAICRRPQRLKLMTTGCRDSVAFARVNISVDQWRRGTPHDPHSWCPIMLARSFTATDSLTRPANCGPAT